MIVPSDRLRLGNSPINRTAALRLVCERITTTDESLNVNGYCDCCCLCALFVVQVVEQTRGQSDQQIIIG